ncbi:response regulator [Rubrivivax gelatinosus]|uniref:Two component transcriptional regulator, winged helix family n=1 Tax=Rubrivivax gelatinosus (strain NBRC 100245 / IL144) TaxID=983917 RepID=I0HPQ6_RUBGI|nr:response regulator [Rubrivivax gelatinosus]MBG6081585.1 DNA-binding response OmpR family regulator [Rubrivivax gelatinosus]BAL94993.1 two component transcriptional regulator, winged helix family [Rubrivivax gelatinosus IL144]
MSVDATDSPLPLPHVLVVDDDPSIRELLQQYLGDHDLRVTVVESGARMMAVFDEQAIDLVVLDLRLPGEDGMQLVRRLRERAMLPIVLLTGRAEEADRVMGLEFGADDYVTKPFSPRELLARIRAQLRRSTLAAQAAEAPAREDRRRAFRFAGWELNLRTRRLISPDGAQVELSNHEFNLLAAFCGAPQRVLSRDQLLAMSRLNGAEVYDRTVDVQVLRLRRKLEADPFHPTLIVTERGAGYRFDTPVETLV